MGVSGRALLWIAEDLGYCASGEVRGCGLKHQKEKRSMDHFAGLDMSVKDTSVCTVDGTGKITHEVSGSLATFHFAGDPGEPCLPLQTDRSGSWTAVAMAVQCTGGSRICRWYVSTRGQCQPVLKAQINKADRSDTRGIAQMMRGLMTKCVGASCRAGWWRSPIAPPSTCLPASANPSQSGRRSD